MIKKSKSSIRLFGVAATITILSLSALAASKSSQATTEVSKKEKSQISSVMNKYLMGFQLGDPKLVMSITTKNYHSAVGGKKEVETFVRELKPRYESSRITRLEVIKKNNQGIFAQIEVKDNQGKFLIKEPSKWFYLIKDNGQWKIDQMVNDFDPSEDIR